MIDVAGAGLRWTIARRVGVGVVAAAALSTIGFATAAAQVVPPASGAAGTVTTCIIGGVDTSVCVDAAVASVNPATVAGPGLPLPNNGGDMTIDKDGGDEVERD